MERGKKREEWEAMSIFPLATLATLILIYHRSQQLNNIFPTTMRFIHRWRQAMLTKYYNRHYIGVHLTIKQCTGIYICPIALTTVLSLTAVPSSARFRHYGDHMAASCGRDAPPCPVVVPSVCKQTGMRLDWLQIGLSTKLVLRQLPNRNRKPRFLSKSCRTQPRFCGAICANLTKTSLGTSFRERSLYAMGGTLHPRLNMQTISNTPTCAQSV